MGASKKKQMVYLANDWADRMLDGAMAVNKGKGAAYLLPMATTAIIGPRPAALQAGVQYSVEECDDGSAYLVAKVAGVKLKENAGQPWYIVKWRTPDTQTHRPRELMIVLAAVLKAPDRKLTVRYDAEAISTRLRELSRSIWPRKKYHISAYSYREAFASAAKDAGVDKTELACAMGHRSETSQRQYHGTRRASTTGKKPLRPFHTALAPIVVKKERPQMARFKLMTLRKKIAAASKVKVCK